MGEVLLVIDMQNGLRDTFDYADVLAKINRRIAAYHAAKRPVIFMQHTDAELSYGSTAWQLDAALARQSTDIVILKTHSDSFFETRLTTRLQHLAVKDVEVCGLQTEYCIDTAIRVGHSRGFYMATISGLSTTYAANGLTASQIRRHHESIWAGSFATVQH
ncbi:isochorismatase family protein [Lactiplantibacillus sp. WILCCON 0030]|uniref:Isochorismatase family protein n=1 Tax=Lactiplantibacillus brownii TaxID=3069269 RepID=A0ABU1A9N8_9LACO|nr:isochorismatase family protein [Lactiplantibacillus brownii]MDQ7937335.1 isochorismatase family protein [Lactiplantibacillus brownii]